jgi:predicted PurR-regulated permease PerM
VRDTAGRRAAVEIPCRTLLKAAAAVAIVWLWLQLVKVVLVLVVATLLAVTLNPIVVWFERRGMSRGGATALVGSIFLVTLVGFVWFTWASLSEQVRYVTSHFHEIVDQALARVPSWARAAIETQNTAEAQARVADYALRIGQSAGYALGVCALGFILTLYLLVEGQSTRDWLVAFAPREQRPRIERTLAESERVIFGYVAGNVITSVIAAVSSFIVLSALKVPAALLLAVLAGVSDFVPVVGFVLTAIPTILMALTVSGKTALIVTAFYIGYNAVETYVISPWAYGGRLKLSNFAVLLAFIVGGTVAGMIGALIVLPFAALYPSIEKIWLRDTLPDETVAEHRELEEED